MDIIYFSEVNYKEMQKLCLCKPNIWKMHFNKHYLLNDLIQWILGIASSYPCNLYEYIEADLVETDHSWLRLLYTCV
jgi:hypothetical protein